MHASSLWDRQLLQHVFALQGVALEALVEALQNRQEAQEILEQAQQVQQPASSQPSPAAALSFSPDGLC